MLVEFEGGKSFVVVLVEGVFIMFDYVDSFVDGVVVVWIGVMIFDVLKCIDLSDVCVVFEDWICLIILEIFNVEGIVLEFVGVFVIDIFSDIKDEIKGKIVVCVIFGGNFDFECLNEVKECF